MEHFAQNVGCVAFWINRGSDWWYFAIYATIGGRDCGFWGKMVERRNVGFDDRGGVVNGSYRWWNRI